MKKILLLSFIALIPCTRLVGANNETKPQLSGMQSNIDSPIAPFTGMQDTTGATCPTEEELAVFFQQIQEEIEKMSPEERAALEQEMQQSFEAAYQQMSPEEKTQIDETMGLLALEEVGQEILQTPEGQAFAKGVEAGAELGAALKEQQIAQEVNQTIQTMAPIIEEEMAKNQPYTPALK